MKTPIAVLISDVHYNLQTLELADVAMRQAIDKANELGVQIVVAGDLHDTKANLRGECINALISTFKRCKIKGYVIIGNHDKINEKSKEHSLEFIRPYAHIVDDISFSTGNPFALLPYFSDIEELRVQLKSIKSKYIIMHQGLQGANLGHYIQDKSAITKEDLAGLRVISGHYHARQTIDLPEGGKFDYIGNPYTLGFGEAKDPEKGYQILYDDGSLEFVPTNLRQHHILEFDLDLDGDKTFFFPDFPKEDLVWVKIKGPSEKLSRFKIENIPNWKFDLIPTDEKPKIMDAKGLSDVMILDQLIDSATSITANKKERLKEMWKQFTTED